MVDRQATVHERDPLNHLPGQWRCPVCHEPDVPLARLGGDGNTSVYLCRDCLVAALKALEEGT